jgi:hypothetical protein
MAALVAGTLWFTPEGCTMASTGEGAERVTTPVFFPNATGVTYDNGVRAVVDRTGGVFAVEGQEFAYAGGYVVGPDSELGRQWQEQCPGADLRDGAVINDVPATPALTEAPAVPTEAGPTAPASDEELGYYAVPAFPWDPADGRGDALLEGTVTFTDEGCPVVESEQDEQSRVTGLIFPNAEGYRDPRDEDVQGIYSSFPNGSDGAMAFAGAAISYRGREAGAGDARWTAVCADAPVDAVFYVEDAPFPVD